MRAVSWRRCLLYLSLSWATTVSKGFLFSPYATGHHGPHRPRGSSAVATTLHHAANTDICCISWDGCLADTVPWRTSCAIHRALAVWPCLHDTFRISKEEEEDDTTTAWLYNKMAAIAHVLDPYNYDTEYAVAVRLLMEEQVLDGGCSNGSKGKYASLYHPQTPDEEEQTVQRRRRQRRGTRPLTVGEIVANWNDDLRETLLWRYGDPMVTTRTEQRPSRPSHSTTNGHNTPSLTYPELLSSSNQMVIVVVPQESDLQVASESLERAGVDFRLVPTAEDISYDGEHRVTLLHETKDMLGRLVEQASALDRTVRRVDASLPYLQTQLPLLLQEGQPSKLSLSLATWAAHPIDRANAAMDPFITPTGLSDLEEQLSAQITTRTSSAASVRPTNLRE